MKNSRDELMEQFNRILVATDGGPRPMTEDEYKEFMRGVYTSSGESGWAPETPEKLEKPEAIKPSPPGWPKEVKMPDGTTKIFRSPEEWRESVKKRYSDEEVMKMIEEDPSHVVTNLMLQRKPEYKHLIYPMLDALVNWVQKTGVTPEKGTLIHKEMEYMLNEVEKNNDLKAAEEKLKQQKLEIDELEKMIKEVEEESRKPSSAQSGKINQED